MKGVRSVIVLLLLLFVTLPVNADIFADLNKTACYTDKISHTFREKTTHQYHRMLYRIDAFLSGSEDFNKSSYATIRKSRMLILFSFKEGPSVDIHLRGKIVLPRFKNKVELTLSQKDNSEVDNQRATTGYDDVVRDNKARIGLKYYFLRQKRQTLYTKLSFKTGKHLGPYLKLGYEKRRISDTFLETTFDNALYYYLNGNNPAASTAITFFKPLTVDYWIAQGNKLFWEGDSKLFLNHTVVLYQIFDLKNRIAWKASYTTVWNSHESFKQDDFTLSAALFHRFDKWFFAEAVPRFSKSRDNGYRADWGFSFNIGMLLGI